MKKERGGKMPARGYHGFVMDEAEFSVFDRLYGRNVSAEFLRRAIRFACRDRKNFEMIFFPDGGELNGCAL